jgi:hypothetical protein
MLILPASPPSQLCKQTQSSWTYTPFHIGSLHNFATQWGAKLCREPPGGLLQILQDSNAPAVSISKCVVTCETVGGVNRSGTVLSCCLPNDLKTEWFSNQFEDRMRSVSQMRWENGGIHVLQSIGNQNGFPIDWRTNNHCWPRMFGEHQPFWADVFQEHWVRAWCVFITVVAAKRSGNPPRQSKVHPWCMLQQDPGNPL